MWTCRIGTLTYLLLSLFSCPAQEGDYGCSRDEMAAALVDVSEGRIPKDRIALRALYTDLRGWPFVGNEAELDEEGAAANYGGITNTGFWSVSRHAALLG